MSPKAHKRCERHDYKHTQVIDGLPICSECCVEEYQDKIRDEEAARWRPVLERLKNAAANVHFQGPGCWIGTAEYPQEFTIEAKHFMPLYEAITEARELLGEK